MSTATDISVDELYALFAQDVPEGQDGCETRKPQCSREAVFVIRWRADGRVPVEDRCSCARLTHQCLDHGETYMALGTGEFDLVACSKCEGFMIPVHVDRIRRG